jgi:DNA primase
MATRTEYAGLNGRAAVNDDKRRVIEATDLVRLIGEQVALRKKGREWACLCPFHDDHNPSMYVVPHKQIYHCFVCGAGGDALSFAMNFFKMPFREALQYLADRAGIALSPPPRRNTSPEEAAAPGVSREGLLQANATAQSFFRAILKHAEHGQAARALIDRRGLSPAMVEQFQLGASPDRWDGLQRTIASKNIDPDPFLAAGLLKPRDDGNAYDALRNRLIFPIHDALGRVIAFGGRKISDDSQTDAQGPKYLNSPETALFNKSATLYALPFASAAIRQQNLAIVTEGYMDAIASHQAGVTHVVATLGTALTPQGGRVLRRLCETVVLLFDGDEAGQRAADRAIQVLFAEPVEVRIATMSTAQALAQQAGLPVPKDPDELLKQPGGIDRFRQMIDGALDALDFHFAMLRQRLAGLSFTARGRAIDEEIQRLGQLGLGEVSPVRRQLIVRRVASLAGVDEATIRRVLPTERRGPPAARPGADSRAESPSSPTAPRGAQEHLLALALHEPRLLLELPEAQRGQILVEPKSAPLAPVLRALGELVDAGEPFTLADVLNALDDEPAKQAAATLAAFAERACEGDSERLKKTWTDCLEELQRQALMGSREDDAQARLERLRQAAERFGGNPRALPRPRA